MVVGVLLSEGQRESNEKDDRRDWTIPCPAVCVENYAASTGRNPASNAATPQTSAGADAVETRGVRGARIANQNGSTGSVCESEV